MNNPLIAALHSGKIINYDINHQSTRDSSYKEEMLTILLINSFVLINSEL